MLTNRSGMHGSAGPELAHLDAAIGPRPAVLPVLVDHVAPRRIEALPGAQADRGVALLLGCVLEGADYVRVLVDHRLVAPGGSRSNLQVAVLETNSKSARIL